MDVSHLSILDKLPVSQYHRVIKHMICVGLNTVKIE